MKYFVLYIFLIFNFYSYAKDDSFNIKNKSLNLSIKELEYLKNKKELNLCINSNWLPLEKIEDGKHIGITSEFIKLIQEKISIPINLIKTENWTESLAKIKYGECDILSAIHKTSLNERYFNFTKPYLKIPLVVVTKIGLPFIDDLNKIKEKSLGISKNYAFSDALRIRYPNINLIEFPSLQKGLSFVQQEKIFGFLDNSMVINHEIQKNNIHDIGITGQFVESFHLSLASRNDEYILANILEKALASIDENTKIHFIEKWNNIKYQTKIDSELTLQTIFFSLVLICIFFYWNLKLKEEIRKKEIIQMKLKESEEKFRTLFDIAPILLNAFDKDGKVILWNKECEKVFGWTFEEIKKKENPLLLFYPDPLIRKEVIDSFSEDNKILYKDWFPRIKNGESIITRWANVKLPNSEIINIGHDVTKERIAGELIKEKTAQLKHAKNELEKLNSSLEKRIKNEINKNTKQQIMLMHQSKLVQMGEMIENIAHQWRQPLAQINSSVLLIDMSLNKKKFTDLMVDNKLSEIETLTAYMSKTIDDFKNFFNPNKQKSIFNIEDTIKKALDIVKGLLHINHIEVYLDIEKDLACYSHLEELQQVILIILNNAIEAIILRKIIAGKIIFKAYTHENNIIMSIEDNAMGIDDNFLDTIFEPYFTSKEKNQGTGVGLYMAKMIIESGLKGSLIAKNKSKGACFIIKIAKGGNNGK